MKKTFIYISFFLSSLPFISMAQDQKAIKCGTHEYMMEVQNKDPEFVKYQQNFEKQMEEYLKNAPAQKGQSVKRVIPIVFHIFHNGGPENIAKERILEQVEILNKDFMRLNTDTNETNPIYKSIAANCDIEFRLAKIDPNGNCTDGIVRYQTDMTYNADDQIKALSRWPNNKYFNVWVVETISTSNTSGGVVLGRSQFPGGSNTTDGVLLKATVTGNTTTFNNYGRTLTHEIGHSLNLRHIWGDQDCGNDMVADTPPHFTANDGCPKNRVSSCVGGNVIEMVENYMDYTDGICQNMFSLGQKARMDAVWNSSTNGRNNLYSSQNLISTGTNDGYVSPGCVPVAQFYRKQEVCANSTVAYSDGSFGADVISYEWTFEGGEPSTSTERNPAIKYLTAGHYDVKLKVTSVAGSDSITKENFLKVFENVSTVTPSISADFEDENSFSELIYNKGDNKKNWERVTNAGFSSSSSVAMKFFGVADGAENTFFLPNINFRNTTGPKVSFDYAYALRTGLSNDKLVMAISRNCGVTFSNVFNKAGTALSTSPNTNSSFTPSSDAQWKSIEIALDNYTNSENAHIKFAATNNGPGNNIYIDNIRFSFTTGMENFILQNLNLQVAPNPFNNRTNVNFFLVNGAKVTAELYDVLGRKVNTIYNNEMQSGSQTLEINDTHTSSLNSGIYLLKLNVDGVEKTEKIILNK